MTPHVGSTSGFWGMFPLVVAAFVFFIDFFAVNAVAKLNHQFSREEAKRYKSFWYGDSMLLPLYALYAAHVFQTETINSHAWFLRAWFQLLLFALAPFYAYLLEGPAIAKGTSSHADRYHYAVAVIVSYVIMTSAFPLFWLIFKGTAGWLLRADASAAVLFVIAQAIIGLFVDGNWQRMRQGKADVSPEAQPMMAVSDSE